MLHILQANMMGSWVNVRFSVVKGKATETEITELVFHGLQKRKKLKLPEVTEMPTNGD